MRIIPFDSGVSAKPNFAVSLYALRFPGERENLLGILVASIAFLISAGGYLLHSQLSFFVQGWMAFILGISLCVTTLVLYRWNPLYFLLIGFLAIPPLYSGVLVLLNVNNGLFCEFGQAFHTPATASKVMLLTAMSLSVSAIGWGLAVRKRPAVHNATSIPAFNFRFLTYAFLAAFSGFQTSVLYGDFIWNAGYYTVPGTPLLGVQIFPALAVVGILGMYSMLLYEGKKDYWYYSVLGGVGVYVLMFCMFFRGGRLEVVATFIGAYFLWLDVKQKRIPVLRILAFGFILSVLLQMWGVFRAVLSQPGISLYSGGKTSAEIIINDSIPFPGRKYSRHRYPLTTIGDIVATFYMTVGLVDQGKLPLLYGKSYLEYIPRTLPKFLYPARPHDLAWIFLSVGEKSGGGLYSLSEAYMNFGVLGCCLVPFLFSFLSGRFALLSLSCGMFQGFFLYVFALSFMLRGIWYGYFALYKSLIAWFLVEMLISLPVLLSVNPGEAKSRIKHAIFGN